jgi:hypothetical protein
MSKFSSLFLQNATKTSTRSVRIGRDQDEADSRRTGPAPKRKKHREQSQTNFGPRMRTWRSARQG